MASGARIALTCGALLLAPAACLAQVNDAQRGLDNLRRQMQIKPAGTPAGAPAVEVPRQEPGVWAGMKPGMTEGEVQKLLGKPDRREDEAKSYRWYWDDPRPAGWVRFDKASRKVLEWRYR